MGYFIVLLGILLLSIALQRIFTQRYHWLAKLGYVMIALIPIVGPIFYLMIDPPQSSPPGVPPDKFHRSSGKGSGDVFPSYSRLLDSLSKWLK